MINIENLRKIYNFIDALPDERVDLGDWRSINEKGELHNLNECGSTACIVGWLPVIFNEPVPPGFTFLDFSDKVGCSIDEAELVCETFGHGGNWRTKHDALEAMNELATKYGHTI
jgi:hypothetical protein